MSYLDILGDFLEQPSLAAKEVAQARPFGLGVIAFGLSGVSLFLTQALMRSTEVDSILPIGLIAWGVWQIVSGYVMAAVLHLLIDTSRVLKAGSATGLFVLLGLSELVWSLAVPLLLVLRFLYVDRWHVVLAVLVMIAASSFILKARSIRVLYGLTSAKAWLFLLTPYAACFLAVFGGFLLATIGVVSSLWHLFT